MLMRPWYQWPAGCLQPSLSNRSFLWRIQDDVTALRFPVLFTTDIPLYVVAEISKRRGPLGENLKSAKHFIKSKAEKAIVTVESVFYPQSHTWSTITVKVSHITTLSSKHLRSAMPLLHHIKSSPGNGNPVKWNCLSSLFQRTSWIL